ncbi:MAG: amino acid racemase [Candidatus Bathyarchaeota archaeon]|nr:amino acid racemase [Candidatus Bathyarchaeota archaeon]MDH5745536.1 amino acid racemase [Candidatus Bathyarchaeota archaeon]
MAKHIGIIAVSSEGAALCYRTICQESPAIMGKFAHPEVTMHTHSLSLYMNYIEKDDWDSVASLMASSAKKLASAGADFAICPDNTVHRAFEKASNQSPIPLISITETVAKQCQLKGYKKVGVLGTKYTMQGPVYRDALSKLKIEMIVPDEKDQENINSIIFNELVTGKITEPSNKTIIKVIQKLKDSGCDAVILGCTEIPLVVNSKNSPLPVIDSTRLLARKALKHSIEKSPT